MWLLFNTLQAALNRIDLINLFLGYPVPGWDTVTSYGVFETNDGKFAVCFTPTEATYLALPAVQRTTVTVVEQCLTPAEQDELLESITFKADDPPI